MATEAMINYENGYSFKQLVYENNSTSCLFNVGDGLCA